MRKIILGLSGGMDSTTLLGFYLEQGCEVHCCSFMYGSKHEPYEIASASDVITFYQKENFPVMHTIIDLRQPFQMFKSALLKIGDEIPEGYYMEESMRKTVVPGRNLIIASILAGIAESTGADAIALGVHSGDHHIYPDCRPVFIENLRRTIRASSETRVDVEAPFTSLNKTEILKLGFTWAPSTPYHLTRTCYKNQPVACGKCGSCRERLEAFEDIGIKDLIKYE